MLLFFLFSLLFVIVVFNVLTLSDLHVTQNPDYVFVNETMNWSSAQRYCRQNFTDLVTVEGSTVWKNIQNVVSPKQKSWIGLYRDSNISWSDGRNFSFYQTPFSFFLFPDLTSSRCCLQHGQTRGHWHFDSCERRFPFICHELLKGDFTTRLL
uniref:C-type lectin domain-containing protein n=1 Tax=Oryzias melastigma TaxID=30732 RepID=A0A3B3B8X7_ORYME